MKATIFGILFYCLSLFSVFAQEANLDPYDPKFILEKGKYKGQLLNTSASRAVKIIAEDEATLTVANFYHQGSFWKAKVPKIGVDKLVAQVVRFPTGIPFVTAAHTQMRIVMKDDAPIVLVPQEIGKKGNTTVHDFVISIEAGTPKDAKYTIIEGMGNNYAIMARIVSTAAKAADDSSRVVSQYPLNIYREEANAFLSHAIRFGDQLGYNKMYNTITCNCTTELFEVLDSAVKYHHEIQPFKIALAHLLDPVAGPTIQALKKRRVLTSGSMVYPALAEELESILKREEDLNSSYDSCKKIVNALIP